MTDVAVEAVWREQRGTLTRERIGLIEVERGSILAEGFIALTGDRIGFPEAEAESMRAEQCIRA